ncbi:hypothetical protein KM043_011204 [Ampulex compressa]|nr:hypothetical protein KM043_011204 [Ampulex compressa]
MQRVRHNPYPIHVPPFQAFSIASSIAFLDRTRRGEPADPNVSFLPRFGGVSQVCGISEVLEGGRRLLVPRPADNRERRRSLEQVQFRAHTVSDQGTTDTTEARSQSRSFDPTRDQAQAK